MADDKANKIVTKEFLHERDMRIFKMRQAGTSTQEIARRFGITTSAVSKANGMKLDQILSTTSKGDAFAKEIHESICKVKNN